MSDYSTLFSKDFELLVIAINKLKTSKGSSYASPDGVVIYLTPQQARKPNITLDEIRSTGTKMLNAALFFTSKDKRKFVFAKYDGDEQQKKPYTDNEEKVALFYFILYMIYSAELPPKGYFTPVGPVQTLLKMLNLEREPSYYMNILADFDLSKMDHGWIKYMHVAFFSFMAGDEFRRSMGVGVAGHELLDVFRMFDPKNHLTHKQRQTYNVIKDYAENGPYWDIHPVTLSSELTALFKDSPNQFFFSKIQECFDVPVIAAVMTNHNNLISQLTLNIEGLETVELKPGSLNKFKNRIF